MAGFKDKVIIVTGAAQGVGRAVALRLAQGGAKLVLADRLAENCAQTKADLGIGEDRVLTVGADLETEDGARQMVEETIAQFGRIDVAINNVGGAIKSKPFWEFSGAELKAEISRSLWPTLWCCREIMPVMITQRAGSIVNIGSAATGWMWRVPYSAAKGGVHALTTCLAREVAEYDIRVNCVAPGALAISDRVVPRSATQPTEADLAWRQKAFDQSLADTPMARLGLPDEVAAAVCFLASDEASYITGQTLFVAGGETG